MAARMAAEQGTAHQQSLRTALFGSGAGGIIGAAQQIVGAGAVVIRQLDQRIEGEIPVALLVAAVDLRIQIQHSRHGLNGYIVVFAKFVDSSEVHQYHLFLLWRVVLCMDVGRPEGRQWVTLSSGGSHRSGRCHEPERGRR